MFFQSEFAEGYGTVEAVNTVPTNYGFVGVPTLISETNARAAFMFGEQFFVLLLFDPAGIVDDATFDAVLNSVQIGDAGPPLLSSGVLESAQIGQDTSRDFVFEATAGQFMAAAIFPDGAGDALDMTLYSPSARVDLFAAEDNSGTVYLPSVAVTETGIHTLTVSNVGAPIEFDVMVITASEPVNVVGAFELDVETSILDEIDPTPITAPAVVSSTLDDAVPTEFYQFEAEEGQLLTAQVIAADTFELDPILFVFSEYGVAIGQNDDDPLTYNPAIANIAIPQSGVYVLQVAIVNGAGDYRLVVELNDEPNPAAMFAGASFGGDLSAGVPTVGLLSPENPLQVWQIVASAGQNITITMVADNGDELDPFIFLYGVDMGYIDLNDDARENDLPSEFDARLTGVTLDADGVYTIVATSFETASFGGYTLTVVLE